LLNGNAFLDISAVAVHGWKMEYRIKILLLDEASVVT
jgi:hypothetical protein